MLLALFSNMAFDSAAHRHTTEALAAGHPGLLTLGFAEPDADGLWRLPGDPLPLLLTCLASKP